ASDVKDEILFLNPYVIVARRGHPLARLKKIALNDLARFEWITPGPTTPRQQALEHVFRRTSCVPRIAIETTSLQVYRNILASTNRLALMSLLEARLNDSATFTILPFESSHLSRVDGIAKRAGWRPTRIHTQFVGLLRSHAHQLSSCPP